MIEVREVGKYGGEHCVHIYTNGCAVSTGFVDLHMDDARYVCVQLMELFGYKKSS